MNSFYVIAIIMTIKRTQANSKSINFHSIFQSAYIDGKSFKTPAGYLRYLLMFSSFCLFYKAQISMKKDEMVSATDKKKKGTKEIEN